MEQNYFINTHITADIFVKEYPVGSMRQLIPLAVTDQMLTVLAFRTNRRLSHRAHRYMAMAGNPSEVCGSGRDAGRIDGRVITYNKDTGWSKNTPIDVQRVGNAMMETKTGLKPFNKDFILPIQTH